MYYFSLADSFFDYRIVPLLTGQRMPDRLLWEVPEQVQRSPHPPRVGRVAGSHQGFLLIETFLFDRTADTGQATLGST